MKHESALRSRGSNRPSTRWRQRVEEAVEFQTRHGRLPLNRGGATERSLHVWLTRQRRLFVQGMLPATKIELLKGLKGWQASPREQLDEAWLARLSAVKEFITINGQVPRYRNHLTEQERVLGVWLHVQHQRRTEGTLSSWRLNEINETLPGWRSRQ
ncbi:helicase associated domain-containing protein [Glutamicibacter soli]